jgi:hypothetical protein
VKSNKGEINVSLLTSRLAHGVLSVVFCLGTLVKAGRPLVPSGRTETPGIDSASNKNGYQEYSFEVKRGRRKAHNLTAICEPIV